jgi:predicted transcriptional regulator
MLNDNFFKKVESKTKVDKNTIMNLAAKLQKNNLKDEATLKEVIHELSSMVGKPVSKEQEDKIISTIVNDKVPKDIDKLVDKNINGN